MSSLPLPLDPYKLLGVSKDAALPEIRSAHRKLVLKCHPDKVQDAALKAIKQDEFQKVQQAYELLSDEAKRSEYDANVKLYELRKEMGRGNAGPRSNPFEYEVKTAEPRPNSYGRQQPPKVYSYGPVHRSHEDVLYEESRHPPKKSASYDSTTDRKRAAEKEEARLRSEFLRKREEKREEEERIMRAREKDAKRVYSEKKKSRDKEKRRGTDDKRNRTAGAYVEDDSEDEYIPRSSEKKSSRHRMEEEIRMREEQAREARAAEAARIAAEAARAQIKEVAMDPKWNEHMEYAGKYMQAARRKGAAEEAAAFQNPHPGMRRADTFAGTSAQYTVRHATPQYSDDESPRRSSGHKESRRPSDTPSIRRDRSRSRRSPSHPGESFIVESSSPPPRKPTLQSYNSAPPNLNREKPSRSKTQDYPRAQTIPQISRAQTFQVNDRGRDRDHRSSGLKKEFSASDSDSDVPYRSPRHSNSPPPRRAETRYFVQDNRAMPIPSTTRHRTDLHGLNEHYVTRERSESPRGGATPTRPPLTRNPPSSESRPRTANRSTSYYTAPEAPEPIILTARPKISREASSSRVKYENVKYGPAYTTENVQNWSHRPGPDLYEKRRDHEYYSHGRPGVYATGP